MANREFDLIGWDNTYSLMMANGVLVDDMTSKHKQCLLYLIYCSQSIIWVYQKSMQKHYHQLVSSSDCYLDLLLILIVKLKQR